MMDVIDHYVRNTDFKNIGSEDITEYRSMSLVNARMILHDIIYKALTEVKKKTNLVT